MKKTPLQTVREQFESKEALVEAVRALAKGDLWVERLSSNKGLARVSNQKLLHLHQVLSEVKDRFGSRGAVIDQILELEKRSADKDYRAHFEDWPTPRLLDYVRSRQKSAQA